MLRPLVLTLATLTATSAFSDPKIAAVQQAYISKLQKEIQDLKTATYETKPTIVAVDPTASSAQSGDGSSLFIQKHGSICTAIAAIKIASLEGPVYAIGINIGNENFRPVGPQAWSGVVNADWAGTQIYMVYASSASNRLHVYRNDKQTPVRFGAGQELHFTYTYRCR